MRKKRQTFTRCPNCGSSLRASDNYCRDCGQVNHDLRLPFKHLLSETLEGLFHFDSKFFRTTLALLLKPGYLTNEFMVGRRVTYVSPIRLYIFLSFLFFFLLSIGSGTRTEVVAVGSVETVSREELEPNASRLSIFGVGWAELRGLSETQLDSLMDDRGIERTPFMRYLFAQVARIATEGMTEFGHRILRGISYMMFVLMPIFALLLFAFCRTQVKYYINCLVFSVHFHSLAFLLFTIYLLLHMFIGSGWLILATLTALVIYCYSALNVVCRQSWWLTAMKTGTIGLLYLLSIITCFLLLVLVSIVIF